MKVQIGHVLLALCLSIGPVIGQTPVPHMLHKNVSDASYAPLTPEQQARSEQQGALDFSCATALHAGDYAQAEVRARQALSLGQDCGIANEVLGSALAAQGKTGEALQAYQTLVVDGKNGPTGQPRNLLPYAQLLLKSGQWAQAVAVYNSVLPHLPDIGPHSEALTVHDDALMQANSRFTADTPEPAALATALHLARGMVYNATPSWAGGVPQDTEAMGEYQKALQLAPNNALTNYYYGVGWRKLAPADKAKFGTAQQAKAALQKAVKIGNANVRKAAAKALKEAG